MDGDNFKDMNQGDCEGFGSCFCLVQEPWCSIRANCLGVPTILGYQIRDGQSVALKIPLSLVFLLPDSWLSQQPTLACLGWGRQMC